MNDLIERLEHAINRTAIISSEGYNVMEKQQLTNQVMMMNALVSILRQIEMPKQGLG